ncbi:MAG: UDP-glucose 4-epimerase [Candidatus Buchananbacteria bacterium RIFCSPHIGHO2_02_FULL_38_8]|uniref:UDP-glucose 4-epimerase n=2 Tax=Candidatus Buchananiibacteriota TaxID=1817903 RepID=A0A1G1XY61_9BACT|nr:MAG: UDP-glucose 4-epimerase [Candidatus Buchananbacteria bacterium RIFCSPHIGHO2_01_FULL_39_8]OGY47281.1 MAG: UDP-glucose 4-epimerase [Candidatus Buchananbacteria bacterium RIFCSPHIGHO2_02_FULL_38_8]
MSKILVTGGAGFIGSNLVDALIDQGQEVLVVDNLSTGNKANLNSKAKFFELDIQDKKLAEIFEKEKPEIVFHAAAQIDVRKSVEDPIWDASQNILGSINLFENCKQFKVKKIIFSSTGGAIYGDTDKIPTTEKQPELPISPYGIAKLAIEKYLNYYYRVFSLPYIALRYSNVYGPRQNSKGEAGVVAIFCDKLLAGQAPIINGDGKQTRDYVYVGDVVRANLLALESSQIGVYNIGTSIETDVNQLVSSIKENIKADVEFSHGPAKAGEQQKSCIDFARAKKELGWQPEVTLEEGIKKTVDWFKKI